MGLFPWLRTQSDAIYFFLFFSSSFLGGEEGQSAVPSESEWRWTFIANSLGFWECGRRGGGAGVKGTRALAWFDLLGCNTYLYQIAP